jgi:dolichyl-phosphate beta-glucosyltransferase
MSRPFLSIIIPCYNEASRLPLTLIDVDRHLSEQDFASEIVVVVSQGYDSTPDILKRFQQIIKNLRVIYLSENLGRGYAVRTGMISARGQWRLMMDADNSTTLTELAKILPYVTDTQSGCEIAIGSRLIEGATIDPPSKRKLTERIGQKLIKTFLVKDILDTACGFKLFSSSSAEAIFNRSKQNGWAIDTEALVIAQNLGYKIKEIPVFWSHDPATHRTTRSLFSSIKEHFAIWYNAKTKSYIK